MAKETFIKIAQKRTEEIPVKSKQEKLKELQTTVNKIQKTHGEESITLLNSEAKEFPHHPTGIMSIDLALGIGGFPKGRFIELYGAESSGKTSLALKTIGLAQKNGSICAMVDFEHALDVKWAKKLGVNMDELMVSQPDDAEQGLEIVKSLVTSGTVDIILVDSTNAMSPKSETEGNIGDAQMGKGARLLSQALRMLSGVTSKNNCTIIWISQIRKKMVTFGSPDVVGVGEALKFYASIRCEVKRTEQIKKNDDVIGTKTRIKIVKNKLAPPFKTAEFDFYFESGYDEIGSIIESALDTGAIEGTKGRYTYNDEKFHGKEKVIEYLKQRPEEIPALRNKIMEVVKSGKIKKIGSVDDDSNSSGESEEEAGE